MKLCGFEAGLDKPFFLIAGPGVYICDECIEVCHSILVDQGESSIGKAALTADAKSELLSRLASIKVEIAALERLGK